MHLITVDDERTESRKEFYIGFLVLFELRDNVFMQEIIWFLLYNMHGVGRLSRRDNAII